MNILEVKNVSKSYGKQKVLNDVSIEVEKGKIYGLLGPNGAGKTTLIRIINQIINLDQGELYFDKEKLSRKHIEHIGYLPEERGLYSKMKVGEHLLYMAQLKGLTGSAGKKVVRSFLEEFDIFSWWHKKVEQLSKGMQQKLQFIIAIMHNPKLIILDEPFTGFDPVNVEIIKKKIRTLKEGGTSFILSTHRMESVEELCDHIALIHKSNKILDGDKIEVRNNFKENIYEVKCSGIISENQLTEISGFELNKLDNIGSNLYNLTLKLLPGGNVNQMIKELLGKVEIISVNELIPSVNDIFISLVKEENHE